MLTDYALNAFVAPELSKLGRPVLPSLANLDQEAERWLPDFLLNHLVRFAPDPRERQFRFALIRRAAAGVAAYELGRAALYDYVSGETRQVVSPYFRALQHFETAAAATYQALRLGSAMIGPATALFVKPDKSTEFARLDRVYVHAKHADDLFDSKLVPRTQTLTVWLTNDGLKCAQATVTYVELSEMLAMLGRVARALVDPAAAIAEES